MLINIWVKDKHSGKIHQVGTNVHDSLEVIDGKIVYYNLQNGDGSGYSDSGYEIVAPPEPDDYVQVTPEQLYLNRDLIHKDLMKTLMTEVQERNTATNAFKY